MSLVDEDAEWRTRRISIIGAAKSFISQLSVGQDLTKVSLPSVFVYPYSALEIGASRALGNFQILQKANAQTDPALRFLGVIAYYASGTKKECFEKKPSNSILGEEHYCSTTLDGETVHYAGEQVSHHPPITAFMAETESQKIRVLVNFETGDIKFHGNSTSVEMKGSYRVQLTNPVTNEVDEYTADKPFPGITIKNMILGTKREPWEGKTTIQCASSKLKAVIKFKEEGWSCTNVVKGKITREENGTSTPLYRLKGGVSQAIKYYKYENRKASDRQEETLVDFEALDRLKITYLPETHWGEKNSLRVWKDMYTAIVDNDMPLADAAKKKVEDAQRLRKKNGEDFVPVHFVQKEGSTLWDFKAEKVREFPKPSEDVATPGAEEATKN